MFLNVASVIRRVRQDNQAAFCASCGGGEMDYDRLRHQILVYTAVALPTLLGIALGCYARTSISNFHARFRRVQLSDLQGLQNKIQVVIAIIGLVGAFLLATK